MNYEQSPLLLKVNQLLSKGGALLDHDPATKGEITVEPGVPKAPSVGLHPDLEIPGGLNLRLGLHPETRTVGVRPNDAEPITRSLPRSHPRENLSIFICTRDIPLFKSIQNPLLPGSKVGGGGGSRFQGVVSGVVSGVTGVYITYLPPTAKAMRVDLFLVT